MKLLSIGNSFSEDAQAWLHKLAKSLGEDLYTRNLYIGGCSLYTHHANLVADAVAYEYHMNGARVGEYSSILSALKSEDWDVVTIQQVSGGAGRPETYEPYLGVLVKAIRENCPRARVMFQQTWEYEKGAEHGEFPRFDSNSDVMYGAICATVSHFAAKYELELIPSGTSVHTAKKTDEFNPDRGGLSLYRDRFHMGLTYGRYLVACTWFAKIYGKTPVGATLVPEGAQNGLCELLQKVAEQVVFG